MTPRSRAGRPLTEAEIRQRTAAGRKSRTDATTPEGVLSFAVGHHSAPGAQDGQVRVLFRPGSALVARLNARPLVMQPYPQPLQTMTTAMAAKRERKDSCTTR